MKGGQMKQVLKIEKKVTRARRSGEVRVSSIDLRKYIGKQVIVKIFVK